MTMPGQTKPRELMSRRGLATKTGQGTRTDLAMETAAHADKTMSRVHLTREYAVTITRGRNHLRIAPTSLAQCRGLAARKRSLDERSNPIGPSTDLISLRARKPAPTSLLLIHW
jgi:hypothetical protein